MRLLQCLMPNECKGAVTHIDDHGFVYCSPHGINRKYSMPCRKMQPWELRVLEGGGAIHYERLTKAEHIRRQAKPASEASQ